MVKVKYRKLLARWKWMTLFFLGCALLISFLLFKFIYRLPEKQMAEDFVWSNQTIQDYFGSLEYVSDGKSGSRVSYKTNRLEGHYSFSIKGKKRSGQVSVWWRSEGSGAHFKVERVALLEPWKDPVVIWSSE